MSTTKKTAKKKIEKPMTDGLRRKGLLLALLSVPAGVIAWDILWSGGFIASLVALCIAWLAVKLFTVATKRQPDLKAAQMLIAIIVAGVVLSFLSGMIMDIDHYYTQGMQISAFAALGQADFWRVVWMNIGHNGAMWGAYAKDIAFATLFAYLGSRGIIRELTNTSRQLKTA